MSTILRDTLDLYDVVCDVCGHGTDTGAWRQEDAWWTAASHGWLIWTDRGDVCPECAERWQEAHQAAAVPLQDPRVGVVVTVLLVVVCVLLLVGLWVR